MRPLKRPDLLLTNELWVGRVLHAPSVGGEERANGAVGLLFWGYGRGSKQKGGGRGLPARPAWAGLNAQQQH